MTEPLDLDALERLVKAVDSETCGVDDAAEWVACAPQHVLALLTRLRAAEQMRDEARADAERHHRYIVAANDDRLAAEAERDALQDRATKAEQELAAIHASRQRIRDSFHCRHDAWCQCPYCRGDADDLAELAADYECQLYAATQKPDQLTALAEGLAQSGTRLEFKAGAVEKRETGPMLWGLNVIDSGQKNGPDQRANADPALTTDLSRLR